MDLCGWKYETQDFQKAPLTGIKRNSHERKRRRP
jgi:hypothetical protein